jgi:hypothetical protein
MQRFFGKYRGICRDNNDPAMAGRIRAEVPYPLSGVSVWALPCLPPGSFQIPPEGHGVWIEFENGDVNLPVWTGIWFVGRGEQTDAPFQAVHPALTDMDGAVVDPDKRDHTAGLDQKEHGQYHDHRTGFYTPHRFGFESHSGHTVEYNDHPGKLGYVRYADRFGRLLEMAARGFTRLRSRLADKFAGLVISDDMNEGQHPDVRTGRYVELFDFEGQKLLLWTEPGEEYVILVDKQGQFIKLDASTSTVTVRDAVGNLIEIRDGQTTVRSNGDVLVDVPSGRTVHLGGSGGQQLATKTFVQQFFNTHIHATPMGPSGPPTTPAPLTPGSDITKKQRSE